MYNVPVINSYEALANLTNNSGGANQNAHVQSGKIPNNKQSKSASTLKKVKIEPICLDQTNKSFEEKTKELNNILKNDFTLQFSRNGIRVFTQTLEDFNTLKDFIKSNKESAYSYSLKNKKPIHLVLKGLPEVDLQQINKDLQKQEVTTIRIVELKPKSKAEEATTSNFNPVYVYDHLLKRY